MILSVDLLQTMMPKAKELDIYKYIVYINKTIEKYEINNKLRICHYISQIGHESYNLSKTVEMGKDSYFDKYDAGTKVGKILGNTEKGDGLKFKGRGLIQITGRWNYTKAGQSIGIDLINNPNLLSDPEAATLSSGWYWNFKKLNTYADQDDIMKITKLINGGYNGIEDRKSRLLIAKQNFNCRRV